MVLDYVAKLLPIIENNVIKQLTKPEYGKTILESKQVGNLTFIIAHTECLQSSYSHRYSMFCYRDIELIFSNSNVIDKTHTYTIQDVLESSRNYFNHISKKLNNLPDFN